MSWLIFNFDFIVNLFTLNDFLTDRSIVAMVHFFLLKDFVQITFLKASFSRNRILGNSFLDELIDILAF